MVCLFPDMKVTRMQMTKMVSNNLCLLKASTGKIYSDIPSCFSRMASWNQAKTNYADYSKIPGSISSQ